MSTVGIQLLILRSFARAKLSPMSFISSALIRLAFYTIVPTGMIMVLRQGCWRMEHCTFRYPQPFRCSIKHTLILLTYLNR
ncbi:uncharacterized protein BKA55DRAFT_224316 [Fusarium redolens]|uniref:Uncharacterized protein n=1 Tax=Fusarium redolens TaxID=48865 RepID=A0A9P9HVY5_FUSRE|nr:uncharacterized protein BKA55DRAFT_224316 [Fusarium redolens]KAH7264829.1 hypothetical protein BKA55DRAFT_224316 [Fusarium redolens]